MHALNETHDPKLLSWVASANQPETDFPIQNLPFAVFRLSSADRKFRCGVAIGDQILDLARLFDLRVVSGTPAQVLEACAGRSLNTFMQLGPSAWSELRRCLSKLLRIGASASSALHTALVPQGRVEYRVPAEIRDYTDFYASIHHATTVGSFFRPDNPLLPNYKWVPIGYHGRASSIQVGPQSIVRPCGQVSAPGRSAPDLVPTRRLDYELEVGMVMGIGNAPGARIPIDTAESHVFGVNLLNDWSARDLQAWEYQPLGPFLAKNFATTISPWLVTLEALAPYRLPWKRPESDPQPLPYLDNSELRQSGAIDIQLEAYLQTEVMRATGLPPQRLSRSSFRHSYWTVAQMVAHHTVNGCNLQTGDLFGSGTQSGPTPEEAGSLLELTANGNRSLELPSKETRTFLEDGDEVLLRGWCETAGYRRIGLGSVSGRIAPPLTY
jgi:fumarylacetoacetase